MYSGPDRDSAPSTREQALVDADSSDRTTPSPVLTAAGTPRQAARTMRLGIGRDTTADEIDRAAHALGPRCTGRSAPRGPRPSSP